MINYNIRKSKYRRGAGNFYWDGIYTKGFIYENGTRVQFKDPVAFFDTDKFYEPSDENYGEIRCNDLYDVIDSLEENGDKWNSILKYYTKDLESLVTKFVEITQWSQMNLIERLESMADVDYKYIIIDRLPTEKIWFVEDKNKIIEELKEVLEICEKENISLD